MKLKNVIITADHLRSGLSSNSLYIPDVVYDMYGSVNREYEENALRYIKFKYYVIYEDTYGYVRLATKFDLFYRLYLQKSVLILSAIIGVIPIGLITIGILIYDWANRRMISEE